MNFFSIILTTIFAFFSTAVMSFISMAMPIGPWIQPTIVLMSIMIFTIFLKNNHEYIALTVIGGSIGGILATAIGFSWPTLYFLDPNHFNNLMQNPTKFSLIIFGLAFAASLLAFLIVEIFEERFIVHENLAFPIGQLVHNMISAQTQFKKAFNLIIGFVVTIVFCILQDGFGKIKSYIPKIINISKPITIGIINLPAIQLELFPIFWAIGYITGELIMFPLIIGALSKIFVVDVINNVFFSHLSSTAFVLAFCSGMILCGTLVGITEYPKLIKNSIFEFYKTKNNLFENKIFKFEKYYFFLFLILLLNFIFFSYFNFSILLQIYLIVFTILCAFQIAGIAGKIGLAQLGRFATFVMVPAMFLFQLNFIQITMIATFVEICGGVTADLLFGRKVAHLSKIESFKVKKFQLIGIFISAVISGIVFWVLINKFTLGSSTLFVQRAQSRALLINAVSFNNYVLLIGLLFGYFLKKIKVNPMLVLGGLLMPFNISIGLIIGALFNYILKNKENWEPFWSGVFASNSIWMLIKALINI